MNKSNKKETKKKNKVISTVKIKKKSNKKNSNKNIIPLEVPQKNNIIKKKPRVKILVTFE